MLNTKLFVLFTLVWAGIFYGSYNNYFSSPLLLVLVTISAWACGSVFLEMLKEWKVKSE